MNTNNRFVLMDGTPGAAGGGPAAAPGPAAAAAPAGAAASAAAPAAAPAESLLAQAGKVPPTEWLPEKFRVMKGENEVDVEASAKKLVESYASMEKRVGTGDLPPKSATEYKVNVPEQFKEFYKEDDPQSVDFRTRAHAAGLTQTQLDFVMGEYFRIGPELVAGAAALSEEQATAELRKEWKTDAEFKTQTGHAFKAFAAFAAPGDKERIDEIGNNPMVLRILARVGAEMQEGGGIPVGADGGGDGEDIKALLVSEAAGNPKHPEYKATRAKIDAFYAKKYGNAPAT